MPLYGLDLLHVGAACMSCEDNSERARVTGRHCSRQLTQGDCAAKSHPLVCGGGGGGFQADAWSELPSVHAWTCNEVQARVGHLVCYAGGGRAVRPQGDPRRMHRAACPNAAGAERLASAGRCRRGFRRLPRLRAHRWWAAQPAVGCAGDAPAPPAPTSMRRPAAHVQGACLRHIRTPHDCARLRLHTFYCFVHTSARHEHHLACMHCAGNCNPHGCHAGAGWREAVRMCVCAGAPSHRAMLGEPISAHGLVWCGAPRVAQRVEVARGRPADVCCGGGGAVGTPPVMHVRGCG